MRTHRGVKSSAAARRGVALAFAAAAQAAAVSTAAAQNEAALRAAFEGRSVTLRVDMPATSQGVDVYPQEQTPVDFRQVAQRLKDHGTAVRTGQSIMVTKVAVKKNSHVEFQLGAGGYGTFTDWARSGSAVSAVGAGESAEERGVRDALKGASGDEKKRLERELSGLRSARARENGRAAAEAQQANLALESSVRAKRLEAGSRFNVRYKHGLPPEALTPDGLARALAPYADFGGVSAGTPGSFGNAGAGAARALASGGPGASGASPGGQAAGGVGALRKGMALADVEALLGPAATAAEVRDGSLTVVRRTYRPEGAQVAASFVGGVLVDYAITPR